jgi:hypothetical protein
MTTNFPELACRFLGDSPSDCIAKQRGSQRVRPQNRFPEGTDLVGRYVKHNKSVNDPEFTGNGPSKVCCDRNISVIAVNKCSRDRLDDSH